MTRLVVLVVLVAVSAMLFATAALAVKPNPMNGLRVVPHPMNGLRVKPNPMNGLRIRPFPHNFVRVNLAS
jgi:hypothetical protein